MDFGLNLYSIRTLIGNEENFTRTAFALKEMGYDHMQFSGARFDPEMIRKVSVKTEMPVTVTHVSMDRIINDTDRLMKEHESFGCRFIGLGALPPKIYADKDEFVRTVEKLEIAGAHMKKNVFGFCLHNHHMELYRHDSFRCLDYIIENAENINFIADVYWLQYGGADVVETLKKMGKRAVFIHLKDYRVFPRTKENGDISFEVGFAPVGDGNLDFTRIIDTCKKIGSEYYLVEQDNAVDFPDPLEQVGRSIKYLKENF